MKQVLFRSKKHNIEFFISEKSASILLKINRHVIEVIEGMKNGVIKKVGKGKNITEEERGNLKRWNNQIRDIKDEIAWSR
jgi:hypothetical protein